MPGLHPLAIHSTFVVMITKMFIDIANIPWRQNYHKQCILTKREGERERENLHDVLVGELFCDYYSPTQNYDKYFYVKTCRVRELVTKMSSSFFRSSSYFLRKHLHVV
jgi:hypothetical protein